MDQYRIRCFVLWPWLYYSERDAAIITEYTMHFNNRISPEFHAWTIFSFIHLDLRLLERKEYIFKSKTLDNYFQFHFSICGEFFILNAISKKYTFESYFFFSLLFDIGNVRIIFRCSKKYYVYFTISYFFFFFWFCNNFQNVEISVRKGHGLQKLKASTVFSFNHQDQLMVPFAPPRCVFLCLKNDH